MFLYSLISFDVLFGEIDLLCIFIFLMGKKIFVFIVEVLLGFIMYKYWNNICFKDSRINKKIKEIFNKYI